MMNHRPQGVVLVARRLATAMSQAPGLSGTPRSRHWSRAATWASCARSSAKPTSHHPPPRNPPGLASVKGPSVTETSSPLSDANTSFEPGGFGQRAENFFGRHCAWAMARASSFFVIFERPLMPRLFARSYSSCFELPS